jgi:hypothetical protein
MDVDEQFELLEIADNSVENAISNEYIGMFTVSNQTKNTELLKGPMAKAICDRLVALQYLGELEVENNLPSVKAALNVGQSHPWTNRFDSIIKVLQKEAGLKQDAWLSSKTFSIIQSVFTFEDPPDLHKWAKLEYQKFFNRAIYARLNVMGMVPQPSARFFEHTTGDHNAHSAFVDGHAELASAVNYCLDYFEKVLAHIAIAEPNYDLERTHLVLLLFDLDKLTNKLGHQSNSIAQKLRRVIRPLKWEKTSLRFPTLSDKKLPGLCLNFVMSIARIECWLNGYGSKIVDGQKTSVFNPTSNISDRTYSRHLVVGAVKPGSSHSIQIAPELNRLVNFWENADRLISNKKEESRKFTKTKIQKEIFKGKIRFAGIALRTIRFADQLNQLNAQDSQPDYEQLQTQVSNLSETELSSPVWKSDYGSSLFDGIKRASKWLWNKIKSVFNFFLDKFCLLVRVVKSAAIKALEYFKLLGKVFSQATEHVMNKVWFTSPLFIVVRDKDFDVMVCSEVGASMSEVEQGCSQIINRTVNFRAACSIVFLIVKAMMNVKSILLNPIWGGIKTLLMLSNFNNLLSEEDKQYLSSAFNTNT